MRTRRSYGVAIACTAMAFVVVLSFRGQGSANPEARLPTRYRLADLIERQQRVTADLRQEVASLRTEVETERAKATHRTGGVVALEAKLDELADVAGTTDLRGAGLRVTLDDSSLERPPDGASVNDLVVHSQDVQAVVNALWRSGAEAISINGQRLVGTSAVLCVGNTLLLNGTVHSPPYVVSAIGATRDRFDSDRLVRRLKAATTAFGLRLQVDRVGDLTVPAFAGATKLTYAQPVPSPTP
ncbi:MAG TPA: DUF881 domain-containing protein [Acidimicrobiales bacterium]